MSGMTKHLLATCGIEMIKAKETHEVDFAELNLPDEF
jgi:hypothetical protein